MRFHQEKSEKFISEEATRFYIAEISCALNYLHSLDIVHRQVAILSNISSDLKPDNILLDQYGHAHLTDFNISTTLCKNKPLHALAGSTAYMAPEILRHNGYGSSVDWWSLGVVMFELLFGKRPFKGNTTSKLHTVILTSELKLPGNADTLVSLSGQQFIKRLLTRDIGTRIGTDGAGGVSVFRTDPWFTTPLGISPAIDWQELERKLSTPPFVPDVCFLY